jgi:hypothetical protein
MLNPLEFPVTGKHCPLVILCEIGNSLLLHVYETFSLVGLTFDTIFELLSALVTFASGRTDGKGPMTSGFGWVEWLTSLAVTVDVVE